MSRYIFNTLDQIGLLLGRPAPLIIGSLILQDHEVPDRISIGGAQAVTVHKLPGGGRIIDAMGADDASIAWRGIFTGPEAARRARTLDVMRQQGNSLILSFGDYTFCIIITHYQYDYQDRGAVISYRIKSEIVPDPANLVGGATEPIFATQGDLASGQDILEAGATAVLAYAQLSDRTSNSRLAASAAQLSSIAANLGNNAVLAASATAAGSLSLVPVQESLEANGNVMQDAIQNFASDSRDQRTTAEPFASALVLAASVGDAAAIAAFVRAGGYVNRASANLVAGNAQAPTPLIHA